MQDSFNNEFCNVIYNADFNAVVIVWKKFCCLEDYRKPTMFAAELLKSHSGSSLLIDARNGFEDDKRDVEWGFDTLLPEMAKSNCKTCVFIVNEIPDIEEEIDLWTAEFKKYFTVHKVTSLVQATALLRKINK